MTGNLVNLVFVFLISIFYSLIEIEIEGKDGWMTKIPTPKILKIGDKEMTLYHIYMLVLIIISFIFQNKMNLTLSSFLYSTSNVLLFLLLEDIFWFILNPYFTINKYKKENIWWHAKQPWILGMPLHNYIISIVIILISLFTQNYDIANNLLYSYLLIGFVIIISPLYHKFYLKTH